MWQVLRSELASQNFEIITVGCDAKGAEVEREFIEIANAEYPCLIDTKFVVTELYNTRNVPALFWIDESGRIVRGNDPAYMTRRDPETGIRTPNERYIDVVRNWVKNGAESIYVTSNDVTQERLGASDESNQQAMAHFRLGVHLDSHGHHPEAVEQFKAALTLKPDNWNYRRQAYNLGNADEYGMTMQEAMQSVGPMYAVALQLPDAPKT